MKTNRQALRMGCLIFGSLVLTSSPALSQSQNAAGASSASTISNVAVTQTADHTSIKVDGQGNLQAHALQMQNPDRLVLDFSGTHLAVPKTVVPDGDGVVRDVRLGQFRPDVARIVVDLNGRAPYQISQEGKSLLISFATRTAQHPAEHSAAANANSGSSAVEGVKFSLPAGLMQPAMTLASFNGNDQPAPPAPEPAKQAAQQAVQQAGDAAATMATSTQAATHAARSKYTGEPISVNLKDVDLRDFFRLIHEISGLNIILDPAVKGNLTIVLDEVPWDQALDIVLENNGLDSQLNGNVLRIATRDTLKKEAETQRDLAKAVAESVAPVTVTRQLKYGKADTLRDTLKKFLSARGDILSDSRTNQLIIRDIPSVIPNIDNLIVQLDRPSQEVEIEARVVEATRSFAQDIGTQLGLSGLSGNSILTSSSAVGTSPLTTAGLPGALPTSSTVSFGAGSITVNNPTITGSGATQTTTPAAAATTNLPLAVNLGASGATSGIGYAFRSPNFALDFFITAAETRGVGKLLSKPRLTVENNHKATVKQGTKIPIQTTINNTVSVQYIDAVLQLEVTPQITADGKIFMDVLVENTQIDNGIPRIQGIPALDTQSVETQILVEDGGTRVIGGVIVSQQQTNVNQVPFIGSLPLIGHLFRERNVNISSQELLFFLTPRIIPG